MIEKTFKIVNNDISDTYHTFDELYEHRCLLYIHLCLTNKTNTVWVEDHWPDWDCLCSAVGRDQISYHIPAKYRHILRKHFNQISKEDIEKRFDGHTSQDVANRLINRLNDLSI